VHQQLRREVVNGASLLYTWAGRNADAAPCLLMAHQDVVPIAPDTEGQWTHPPFSGAIADGCVWGRGALDDKGNLHAILEAVERRLGEGFQPPRTIYLAFGHDEETLGLEGARQIARLLRERGVHLEFVLDEGLVVTQGIMAGIAAPVALIGIGEKGLATLRLSSRATPGHSSMPPRRTAIGRLAEAVARLEQRPLPATLPQVVREMLAAMAPEHRGPKRLILSNLWLFGPLARRSLAASPSTAAMLRSTAAATVMRAGEKVNILPERADAHVNFRLLPGDDIARVVSHARRAIADPSIEIEVEQPAWEAPPVSRTGSAAYALVRRTLQEIMPGAVVAPAMMMGLGDARHYAEVADDVYRFSPMRFGPDDVARLHGTDERLPIANFAEMIHFFYRLVGAAPGAPRA
jgi:carboxypeptidase PM20D1